MLSICYLTFRQEPCIQWFLDGLHHQCGGDYSGIQLIVIDYYRDEAGRKEWLEGKAHGPFEHVAPKPTVWQGPHRLTKEEFFAASNARNTGICMARFDGIAFVDDLSILGPQWLLAAGEAVAGNYVAMGMYEKIEVPVVDENGVLVRYEPHRGGRDCRHGYAADGPVDRPGSLLYGCSVAGPISAFLTVNGFDEDCDSTGLGTEDYTLGMMMNQNGIVTKLDRRLWTSEWWSGHYRDRQFARRDKGVSPNDKSHAMLHMVMGGRKIAPNYFGDGGIAGMRKKILSGDTFPVMGIPDRDWYDGQPLSEL